MRLIRGVVHDDGEPALRGDHIDAPRSKHIEDELLRERVKAMRARGFVEAETKTENEENNE